MSRLVEFRALEQKLAAQLIKLEALKGSSELQKEIEFEGKLHELVSHYGFSLRDIINIAPCGQAWCSRKKTTSIPSVEAVKEPARRQLLALSGADASAGEGADRPSAANPPSSLRLQN
ncbi:hypothetical protein NLO83_25365 [Pseudomonas tremae]|nr:hypothetical protein [Pseudomonas coronafaciens]MCQ3018900.1 hypothetical protein [Pseudomonas tremae]